MKKILFIITLLLLVVGCSKNTENNNETKIETKVETKNLKLVLDYTPNTNHTGFYVAKEKGFFKDENLSLEIVQPPEDGAPALVASGSAEFGISYQDVIAPAYTAEKKLPVTNIAALVQHNTSGIISKKGKGITTPKGLEGKNYATWGMEIEQAMIKNVMEKDGGDYSKLKLIPSNYSDIFTALNTDIDSVWIFYGWDGIAAKVKNFEFDYFAFKDINKIFDYYTPTLIVNDTFAKENSDIVKAFLRAVKKGYEFAISNPKEAADILIKYAPELDKDIVYASQEYLKNEYISDAKKWGYIDSNRWNAFYNWLFENKLISKEIPKDFGFTNEYLPE